MSDQVAYLKDQTAYVKRVINAPIERVFKAWTDPDELKQWHAPGDVEIPEAVSENHVGGKRSVVMKVEDQIFRIVGTYKEFDEPNKLVYSWNDPAAGDDSIATINFTALADQQTEVEITHTNMGEGEESEGGFEGWKSIMTRLERYLG